MVQMTYVLAFQIMAACALVAALLRIGMVAVILAACSSIPLAMLASSLGYEGAWLCPIPGVASVLVLVVWKRKALGPHAPGRGRFPSMLTPLAVLGALGTYLRTAEQSLYPSLASWSIPSDPLGVLLSLAMAACWCAVPIACCAVMVMLSSRTGVLPASLFLFGAILLLWLVLSVLDRSLLYGAAHLVIMPLLEPLIVVLVAGACSGELLRSMKTPGGKLSRWLCVDGRREAAGAVLAGLLTSVLCGIGWKWIGASGCCVMCATAIIVALFSRGSRPARAVACLTALAFEVALVCERAGRAETWVCSLLGAGVSPGNPYSVQAAAFSQILGASGLLGEGVVGSQVLALGEGVNMPVTLVLAEVASAFGVMGVWLVMLCAVVLVCTGVCWVCGAMRVRDLDDGEIPLARRRLCLCVRLGLVSVLGARMTLNVLWSFGLSPVASSFPFLGDGPRAVGRILFLLAAAFLAEAWPFHEETAYAQQDLPVASVAPAPLREDES